MLRLRLNHTAVMRSKQGAGNAGEAGQEIAQVPPEGGAGVAASGGERICCCRRGGTEDSTWVAGFVASGMKWESDRDWRGEKACIVGNAL
jgi:hypothetical protein